MTGYEFVKLEMSRSNMRKAELYDARELENLLVRMNKNKDLREQKEYKDAEDAFIDCTMSCERSEAIGWMRYWMGKAIAYGLETKDKRWGYFFLAAYDLRRELAKRY